MKRWLAGDFAGVEARQELDVLRRVALEAAVAGEPLEDFWSGLAEHDPIAAAELAAGPRAVGHELSVRATLKVIEVIEEVVAPGGLYGRLADLAPTAKTEVLETAVRRHPGAAWLPRLARICEDVPGTIHLTVARELGALPVAAAVCAKAGFVRALREVVAATGSLEAAVALLRAGDVSAATEAAGVALDADPSAPILPWLAAVHGPDLDALLVAVADHVRTDAGRAALHLLAADFPATRAVLAS